MTRKNKKTTSSLWIFFGFFAGIIILLVAVSFGQELRRRMVLQQRVLELKQEIRNYEQNISSAQKLIEYLKTDSFVERAAHEKLGYKKPGEFAVIVPEGGKVASASDQAEANEENGIAIPRQWWNLFFAAKEK